MRRILRHRPVPYLGLLAILAVGLYLSFEYTAHAVRDSRKGKLQYLNVKPRGGELYFLGNSMFKTGLDFQVMKQSLPQERLVFEYHNGHYSGLWFLLVKNALLRADQRPKVLIWGFRPTYAEYPAFRKKRVCDVEKFLTSNEPVYDILTKHGEIRGKNSFYVRLSKLSSLYASRETAQKGLDKAMRRIASAVVMPFLVRGAAVPNDVILRDAGLPLSELLVRRLTAGAVGMTEETVSDQGEAFIQGPLVPFANSFAPRIAAMVQRASIPQLVIIFKPASVLNGSLPAHSLQYARDARAYFRDENIPYIDLIDEDRLQREHFAKGDHYNPLGRTLVTAIVAARLERLLANGLPAQAEH